MNKPSSTITAATLAGSAMTVVWGLVGTFTTASPTPMLVAGSVALASGLVGYFTPEKVLKPEDLG